MADSHNFLASLPILPHRFYTHSGPFIHHWLCRLRSRKKTALQCTCSQYTCIIINGICHDSHAICYIVNVESLHVLSDYQAEINSILSALIDPEKVMAKSIIDKNNYKLITHRILKAHKLYFIACIGFMLCSDECIVNFPYQFVGDASLLTSDKACLNEPSSLISTCVDMFLSCNSKNSNTQRLNRCPKNRYSKFGVLN